VIVVIRCRDHAVNGSRVKPFIVRTAEYYAHLSFVLSYKFRSLSLESLPLPWLHVINREMNRRANYILLYRYIFMLPLKFTTVFVVTFRFLSRETLNSYRMGQKVSLFIVAITLSTQPTFIMFGINRPTQ